MKTISLISALLCAAVAAAATDLNTVITRLESALPYAAHVRYTVMLPSSPDDVVYDIDITAGEAGDSSQVDYPSYIIDWTLHSPQGDTHGFNAHHRGDHYRFRPGRLQEYHYGWDSIPFLTGGGVERQAQFTDLLPNSLASLLRRLPDDAETSVTETTRRGEPVTVVNVEEQHGGITGREITLVLDRATLMPIEVEYENNPGSISEQTVNARFSPLAADSPLNEAGFDEEALLSLYPEQFQRFRTANFRVENLRGEPIPRFTLPTLTGERYTYHRGDCFATPVVIALFDPAVASTAETVATLRDAVASLPRAVDLIAAFIGTDLEATETAFPDIRPGETVLVNASALARDCGVNAFPTFIFVGTDGRIADIQLGDNKALSQIVIEKTALL